MKAIYIAVLILAGAMAFGQYANADTTEGQAVLEDYYSSYVGEVGVVNAHRVVKRNGGGWNCYPYGDQEVGFYQTLEQYHNAYDPSIYAVE